MSERDSFDPDGVSEVGGGPVDCGAGGAGGAGGGGNTPGGWWSGGYAAANTTISDDVAGDDVGGDGGTAAMDSGDDTSGFGGNSVMSSQYGGEGAGRQRPNWKYRICVLVTVLASIGGLVSVVYAGMAMSNKHNASQIANNAEQGGGGGEEEEAEVQDDSNGTGADAELVVVPPAPLNLDVMCSSFSSESPSASIGREGRNVTTTTPTVNDENGGGEDEDGLAQCTMACLEARCCFAPNDEVNCRDKVKGNDEACDAYEICRDVLRGGGGDEDENGTTTTTENPNEELYSDLCPELGEDCVDETNLAECRTLVDRGCRDLVRMESCPLQFRCNDGGEESPSTEVNVPVTIRAQMGRYPQSPSDYEPEGEVAVTIQAHNLDIDLTVELSGIAPDCDAEANENENGCGVHIHEGTDCTDAETVGGHYWNEDVLEEDPWAEVRYDSDSEFSSTSQIHVVDGNGYGAIHNAGRVVIVHDQDGSRIACGVLGKHPHMNDQDDVEVGGGVVNNTDSEGAAAALADAREVWASSGPTDYDYVFRRSCMCPKGATLPMLVRVRDNAVYSVTYYSPEDPNVVVGEEGGDMIEVVPEEFASGREQTPVLTIDDMFDLIQNYLDDPDIGPIDVTYDVDYGFPALFEVDMNPQRSDDEETVSITSLVEIGGEGGGGGGGGGEGEKTPEQSTALAALSDAKELWESSGPMVDYDFVFRRICMCLPDSTLPMLVQVRDGQIFMVTYVDSFSEGDPMEGDGEGGETQVVPQSAVESSRLTPVLTVDDMFEHVQSFLDDPDGHDLLKVTYDDEYGYPASFEIDVDDNLADDEESFTVTSLVAAGGADNVTVEPPPGGDGERPPEDQDNQDEDQWLAVASASLDEAESRWMESGPPVDYDYTYHRTRCSCTSDATRPMRVQVRSDEVVHVEFVDEPGTSVAEDLALVPTVRQMFDGIRAFLNDGVESLEVEYETDGEFGYPKMIDVDREAGVADDEETILVSDLVLAGGSGGGGDGGGGSSGLILKATMGRYPDSDPSWDPHGTVRLIFDQEGQNLDVSLDVGGVEVECSGASNAIPNGCGVHVHSGTDCTDEETVGGHYWNEDTLGEVDPWADVRYDSGPDLASTSTIAIPGGTGFDAGENLGRVVVIHDENGGRIACGVLVDDEWGDGGPLMPPMMPEEGPSSPEGDGIYNDHDGLPTGDLSSGGGEGAGSAVEAPPRVLRAEMGRYPESTLATVPTGAVTFVFQWNGDVDVKLDVSQVSSECSPEASRTTTDGCGVAIYEGESCTERSTVGGHYYDAERMGGDDPWEGVAYSSKMDSITTSELNIPGGNGYDFEDNVGHVVVMHNKVGSRIACGVLVYGELPEEEGTKDESESLAENRQMWESRDVANYDYIYESRCSLCDPRSTQAKKIEVRGGVIATVTYADDGSAVPEEFVAGVPTINDLFDRVQEYIDGGEYDKLSIEYDGEWGYPSLVEVDRDETTTDDDEGFTASELKAMYEPPPEEDGGEGTTGESAAVTLSANIKPYPGSDSDLDPRGDVTVTFHTDGRVDIAMDVQDVEASCSFFNAEPNGCGIHIHEGMTCLDAETVGGHYWNLDELGEEDPWADVRYTSGVDLTSTSQLHLPEGNGFDADGNRGHVVVIHDEGGGRIACGILEGGGPALSPTPGDEGPREDIMMPNGDGHEPDEEASIGPMKLSAVIGPYPGSDSDLDPRGDVTMTFHTDGRVDIAMDVQDIEASCSLLNDEPNGCGVHVHEGMNCVDAESVGGHYWNKDEMGEADDPWADVRYTSGVDLTSTSQLHLPEGNAFDVDGNRGHVVVIHDESGGRIACGVLEEEEPSHNDEGREDIMMPNEDGYNPDEDGMNPDEDSTEPKEDYEMGPDEDGTNADEEGGVGEEDMNPDEDKDSSTEDADGEMYPGENITSTPATGGEGGAMPADGTGPKSHEIPGGVLPWSSELCSSLGYAGKFDFCGEIEFCEGSSSEGSDMDYRRRRLLRARKLQDAHDAFDESTTYPASYGWRIPGRQSCRWPGPAMRMQRGKSYGLFAKGSGTEMETNLHTHGLHIAGHGNSDDILRKLSGNDVIIYNYTIPDYHMGGTFWYHAHRHGQSDTQLRGGALGMLIIEDGDDVGSDEDGVRRFLDNELTMLASNLPGGDRGLDDFQWRASFQNYVLNADEWYRMRILTVSVDAHQSEQTLSFGSNCEARAIAHDGVFRFEVPAAAAKSEFVLTSASRLDVALRCSAEADIQIDDMVVATISMSGTTADSSLTPYEMGDRQWSSTRPPYLKDLRDVDVNYDDRWEIKVDETNINGQAFSMDTPLCNDGRDFTYGQVNEWTMKPTMHPLHVHLYHMQIASEGGCGAHEYGEYYDTIYHNALDYKNTCNVRLWLIDVAGKTVLHCHMPLHQEQGSMGFIQVKGGPVQPDEPRVHSCDYPPCDEPVHVNMCSSGNPEGD